jgi:predicted nucleotide-binding protein
MAKSDTNTEKPVLTISNSDFKERISVRIKKGEELFDRQIQTNPEFEKLRLDVTIWSNYNFELLQQIFNRPDNDYMKSYNQAGYTFMGQMGDVRNNPVQTKKNLIKYKLDDLKALVEKFDVIKSEVKPVINRVKKTEFSKKEVFIVHGHDDLAKTKTARFVERLGLRPIILHEQSSNGQTIIEKIEKYSDVGFGIVLYTPCDVGSVKGQEDKLGSRARQNVVFEHGFLIGKIGRKNVCALVKDKVEVPNDISGVVYVKMDSDDAWTLKVAKELKSSGYDIDTNNL